MARWKDTRDYIYVSDEDAQKLLDHISPKFHIEAFFDFTDCASAKCCRLHPQTSATTNSH